MRQSTPTAVTDADQPKNGDFAAYLKGPGSVMTISSRPTGKQLLLALGYAAIFPLTNLIGGAAAMIGILVTLPFLPIGWVAGMAVVSIARYEPTYLVGASLAVLAQVLMLVWLWNSSRERNVGPSI